jgi:hypothetical protein
MGGTVELSDELIRNLSEMRFRADAERRISYMPLSSIYWTDEISEAVDDLFEDGNEERLAPLLRLFTIRGALWTGTELCDTDRAFWDAARASVPDYALFHRLEVSEEDVAMYREVARASNSFWHTFFLPDDDADEDIEGADNAAELEDIELLTEAHEDVEILTEADIVSIPQPGE